jgi:hypothetical protein
LIINRNEKWGGNIQAVAFNGARTVDTCFSNSNIKKIDLKKSEKVANPLFS